MAVFEAKAGTFEFVGFEGGLFDERPEFGRLAVDEFGAELDDFVALADGVNATAYAGTGFEEGNGAAGFGEGAGGGEAGHAGSDYEDVCGGHICWML
jgi:hypothetical protein